MSIIRLQPGARHTSVIVMLAALIGAGLACQDRDGADARDARGAQRTGPTAYALAGHTLAAELQCGLCHALKASGGGQEAPALIGNRPEHGEDWLRAHLQSPGDATRGALSTIEVETRQLYEEEILALVAWSQALGASDQQVIAASPVEIQGGWIFFDYVCTECHVVHGRGGDRGPDLSRAGTQHPRAWMSRQILFPKEHKSDGEMPSFAGKISEGDLERLLDYLMQLE